jgi:hypothetical protein
VNYLLSLITSMSLNVVSFIYVVQIMLNNLFLCRYLLTGQLVNVDAIITENMCVLVSSVVLGTYV